MSWISSGAVALAMVALSLVALVRYGKKRWADATSLLTDQLRRSQRPPTALRYEVGEVDGLPAPVRRYFRSVLRDGQPIVTRVLVQHTGSFNVRSRGEWWLPFSSEQNVTTRRPGFVWNACISALPGISVRIHDAYVGGVGKLDVSVLGVFPVARLEGRGEIARGELVRYLAESVWYPTALLPSQGVCWSAIDDRSAHATLVDDAVRLTARFTFDAAGLIEGVHVDARGAVVDGAMVMMPWEGRMSDYQMRNGMRVPTTCEAAWLWPDGRKPYWRGKILAISHEFAD